MKRPPPFLTFAPTVTDRDESGLPKKFEGVAYSGGVIPDYGWYGDAVIDLATMHLPEGAVFALVDHDPTKRAGKLTATMANNKVLIAGEFFTATDAGKEVAALFAEGAPWQLSVGIQAKAKSSQEKTKVRCNGADLECHTLFSDASLREVSFVPVGADPNTSAVAFSKPGDSGANDEDDMTLEALTARVAELEASLQAATTRADAAEAKVKEIATVARKDAIAKLSAEIGRKFSDDEDKAFAAMDEPLFVTMAGALRASKPKAPSAPAHLFSEQATEGAEPPSDAVRIAKAQAKIINQVSGKAA